MNKGLESHLVGDESQWFDKPSLWLSNNCHILEASLRQRQNQGKWGNFPRERSTVITLAPRTSPPANNQQLGFVFSPLLSSDQLKSALPPVTFGGCCID